jgi:hypothetical protein
MSSFSQIIAALLMGGLGLFLFLQAKKQPQIFEKSKMIKSLNTMAVMALILIALIWLCIAFLRG